MFASNFGNDTWFQAPSSDEDFNDASADPEEEDDHQMASSDSDSEDYGKKKKKRGKKKQEAPPERVRIPGERRSARAGAAKDVSVSKTKLLS